jgi:hypothetical protein
LTPLWEISTTGEKRAKLRQEATQLAGRDEQGEPVFGGGNFPPPKEEAGKTRDAARMGRTLQVIFLKG